MEKHASQQQIGTFLKVPERRSSQYALFTESEYSMPSGIPRSPIRDEKTIPPRGQSSSPIRTPASTYEPRRVSSRTFIPPTPPTDVLDFPRLAHPRVEGGIRLFAPLFMGGATVEGEVLIAVDGGITTAKTKAKTTLLFGRITVSLVGIERSGARQHIFQSLATDLIDVTHPPPISLQREPLPDGYWEVKPGSASIPFQIDLPVVVGPPPYESKKFGIKYLLSTTVEAKTGGKREFVRFSKPVTVLSVYDPERALLNLPNPLIVSDTLHLSQGTKPESIDLTAGLHRQTWISGYILFIDLHITNHSHKPVRKIQLQLERAIISHDLAAATLDHESGSAGRADSLRVPDLTIKSILAKYSLREPADVIFPKSTSSRTCELSIPSGLVSITTGRFFGVRFFLNVQLSIGFHKKLKVQLPITLIHPNSIDIPPNVIGQVAEAIERKHRYGDVSGGGREDEDEDIFLESGGVGGNGPGGSNHRKPTAIPDISPYRYTAGRAFTAAREESHRRFKMDAMPTSEVDELTARLEASPRKHHPNRTIRQRRSHCGTTIPMRAPLLDDEYDGSPQRGPPRRRLRGPRHKSFESRAPRLQRSTSGLGFEIYESDKENHEGGGFLWTRGGGGGGGAAAAAAAEASKPHKRHLGSRDRRDGGRSSRPPLSRLDIRSADGEAGGRRGGATDIYSGGAPREQYATRRRSSLGSMGSMASRNIAAEAAELRCSHEHWKVTTTSG